MQKYLVRKFTSSEEKSPSQAVFNSMVWHSGISGSEGPCSVAQFTHPLFVSLQLPFGVFCEQWANVEDLNCFHCNHMYFPGETLGTPVKTSFRAQALLLPAASPFSPCNTLCCSATPQPSLAGGCKLFSPSFPQWFPNGFADSARNCTRMKSWGTAALQPSMKLHKETTDRDGKALAGKSQENHVYSLVVYYR